MVTKIPQKVESLAYHLLGRKCCSACNVVRRKIAVLIAQILQQPPAVVVALCSAALSALVVAAHSCLAKSKRDHSAATGTLNFMYNYVSSNLCSLGHVYV